MARKLRLLVAGNSARPGVRAASRDLCRIIGRFRGLRCVGLELARRKRLTGRGADMVLALGGDGTMLSVCRQMECHQLPVLGIKFGHKGFLAEVQPGQMQEAVERLAAGAYAVSDRLRIEGEVLRSGVPLRQLHALNDLVIHSGPLARVIFLDVRVDDVQVASYDADGVIVSTPTGSTAYSLAAGGPIVAPEIDAMVITPICAHTLAARAMVVGGASRIEIGTTSRERVAALTADGQVAVRLRSGDMVRILRGRHPFRLVELGGRGLYQSIRENLHWAPGRKGR
jgi:NAD+ kinase